MWKLHFAFRNLDKWDICFFIKNIDVFVYFAPTDLLQGLDLPLCRALSPGDDGSGVSHAAAGRRGHAGDEGHHRLRVVAFIVVGQELGGPLLGLSADLADHHDALGVGVLEEEVQAVHEVCAVEGVAADAHAQSLAKADLRSSKVERVN